MLLVCFNRRRFDPSPTMIRTPRARHDDTSRIPDNVRLPLLPLKSEDVLNLRLSSNTLPNLRPHIFPARYNRNSPPNVFHSTTSAAFYPQPTYNQMAVAANGQDYCQNQNQQPGICMPLVSHNHNPPPNPVQLTAMDQVHAQPTD